MSNDESVALFRSSAVSASEKRFWYGRAIEAFQSRGHSLAKPLPRCVSLKQLTLAVSERRVAEFWRIEAEAKQYPSPIQIDEILAGID